MNYDWLMFDADGTLFDYDHAESAALARTFEQTGYPFELGYLQTYRRINGRLWQEFEQGKRTQTEIKAERFDLLFDALGIQGDPALFSHFYLQNLAKGTRLIDGAKLVVGALHGHVGLLLVTNGLTDVQRPRLRSSAIGAYFADAVISEEVGVSKPDTRFFDIAFERMRFPKKGTVLVVGDSLTSDVQGANNYGIDACWFNPDKRPNSLDLEIRYQIERLEELLPIVGLT